MLKQSNRRIKLLGVVGGIIVICIVVFFIINKLVPSNGLSMIVNNFWDNALQEKEKILARIKAKDILDSNRLGIVKIYAISQENSLGENKLKKGDFLARGISYSETGLIITSRSYFQEGISYLIEIPGKEDLILTKPLVAGKQLVAFKVNTKLAVIANISKVETIKDEAVIVIGGQGEDIVITGEVFLVDKSTDDTFIITTLSGEDITTGAPLINVKQQVIGLYVKESVDGKAVFIAVHNLAKSIRSIVK